MSKPSISRIGALALLTVYAGGSGVLGDSPPKPAREEKSPFQVPPGFVVEQVAGPPLVEHPMMACFDDRGRLFVAEAAGLNLKAEELLQNPPNLIRLLEDTDGDGRFDKGKVFADKMTFPMGVLWYDGALYTASPPSLWRLEDTTGDGVAEKRHELVTKFGFIGNAADIHGPFLGPDGRFYWCDGRHGHQIRRPDGSLLEGKAARIFRCRPDGGEVEVVCGGGMDNPVEIAFTAEGEAFATVNILTAKPRRSDAIIQCVEGGVFPYHEVYKEFKRTGDLLPPVAHLGWVAPAGLMRYRSGAFGAEYRENLFSAQFNTHRIQRHIVERDGATFRLKSEDFLVATDPDFHPTDVLEDADGSLLVINTGGWFRIGCPTSQIAKPQIKGAIYRVRRKGADTPTDPRGLALEWDRLTPQALTPLLSDCRFAVRDRAVQQLAKQGQAALAALKEALRAGAPVLARRNAVWALTRIDGPDARSVLRTALEDKDGGVRLAATHAVGLLRDGQALPRLTAVVTADTPALRREAATALGRIRKAEAVPALFEGVRAGGDRFLEHSLIYALIEIANRQATLNGLRDASPVVQRAALIALDQMDGGNLTREWVTPLLNTTDPILQQAALAIITARPGWAAETVGLLREWLAQRELDPAHQESLRGALLAFAKDKAIQELVAHTLRQEQTPVAVRLLLLETMARVPLERLPPGWVAELGRSLDHAEERVVRQAVGTIRAGDVREFDLKLYFLAKDTNHAPELRIAALSALAPRLPQVEASVFEFLTARLGQESPPLLRLAAAEVLGNARLDEHQLRRLAQVVAKAGALEMPHLLAAFERSHEVASGKALVTALGQSPGLQSLSPEAVRRTVQGYPAEVRRAAEPLLKRLEVDTEKQKARLAELEPVLSGGDLTRGRDVFFGKKAACAACHTVQAEGGRVGPDLSKIGSIRTGRDLLEAVVFPSASIVRGYEPYVIATRDGRLHTGIIARETAEAIYLVTADRAEVRLARSAVEAVERGKVSIMPQGLDAQLSGQELRDLIAFLQALR